MSEQITQIHGSDKFVGAVNRDINITLKLQCRTKPLQENTHQLIVNEYEQYDHERQNSTLYRLYGKVTHSWKFFNEDIYTSQGYLPVTGRIMDVMEKDSWAIYAAYPAYSSQTISEPDYTWDLSQGLPVTSIGQIDVNGSKKVLIESSFKHMLSTGEYISIASGTYKGIHKVILLGKGDLSTYNRDHFFVIDTPYKGTASDVYFRRNSSGVDSIYFFRKFEILSDITDYDIYPCGFSKGIFGEEVRLFHFNQDVDISGRTDYLGRPLSELHLYFVKRAAQEVFTDDTVTVLSPAYAITSNSLETVSHYITGNAGTYKEKGQQVLGDMVEYNSRDLEERVFGKFYHLFHYDNSPEYFFYDPTVRIPIRAFSSYIESGDDSVVGIPSYAERRDGLWFWRDLLDIGFNENGNGVDYPFLNGAHYLYSDVRLLTRHQLFYDPYDDLDMGNKLNINTPEKC